MKHAAVLKSIAPLSDENRQLMGAVICTLVFQFKEHPYHINNGRCLRFARKLKDLVPGAEIIKNEDYAHVYVKYHGFYYDAEEPYGVPNWDQLPLIMRTKNYRRREGITLSMIRSFRRDIPCTFAE